MNLVASFMIADHLGCHAADFNPQIDRQAEDRCHRLGQTKQVTVYRMVSTEEHAKSLPGQLSQHSPAGLSPSPESKLGQIQIVGAEMGVKSGHLAWSPPRLHPAQLCCKLLVPLLSLGCQSAWLPWPLQVAYIAEFR